MQNLVLGDIILTSACEFADTQYYRANLFIIAEKWTNSSVRLKAA